MITLLKNKRMGKIKWFLALILFSSFQHLNPFICISLGDSCAPAFFLRDNYLRKEAFPFDWIATPYLSLYNSINDNFVNFFEQLKTSGPNAVTDYYGLAFLHDLPTIHNPHINPLENEFTPECHLINNWQSFVPQVKEKYLRRIQRFITTCANNKEKVFFFRHESNGGYITSFQAINLRDLISKKYPSLDFEIIYVSSHSAYQSNWNLEKIRNVCIPGWYDRNIWKATLYNNIPELFAQNQPQYKTSHISYNPITYITCTHCKRKSECYLK